MNVFSPDQEELARRLFDTKAVEFGTFRLKLHDTQPDAPLSPIFFNLRTPDNPKPGPIGDRERLLTKAIWSALVAELGLSFDGICGIPNAGTPLAEAFGAVYAHKPHVVLHKTTGESSRKIDGIVDDGGLEPGARILLIDDVVTAADTKLEALVVLREAGFVVEHLLVLVDREQSDGVGTLERNGCTTHAIFRLRELLSHYVVTGKIDAAVQGHVLDYIVSN